jgi:glycosyltransferase involved in cell wall biosynthesis
MSGQLGVSIIIPNYNYARFVGEAIESALAQDHPDVEVIVVDDGSTDESRSVIDYFGGRIRSIFLGKNVGNVEACKAGWPLAQYPIVIFLDSDDILMRHAVSAIVRVWTPELSKIQFPLSSIDERGCLLYHTAPKYPEFLDTAMLRAGMLDCGTYPCSQGSGNAYSIWFLGRIKKDGGFVLPSGQRSLYFDAILEINSPFYGKVLTLHDPLVYYRMHTCSEWQSGVISKARFERQAVYFNHKIEYIANRCLLWGVEFNAKVAAQRSLPTFEYRLAASRLTNFGVADRETPCRLLMPALRACRASHVSPWHKVVRGLWLTAVALTPRALAHWLIAMRFVPARRPKWLEYVWGR